MDPHGVEVLDGADDHHVVGGVTHHLQLVLLPTDNRLLHQNLVRGRGVDPPHGHLLILFHVVSDAAAGAPQGEGGADDGRETHRLDHFHGLGVVVGQARAGDRQADLFHCLLEEGAVLGLLDGRKLGADELHPELLQSPVLGHRHGGVESRLAAECGEHRVGTLLLDDFGKHLGGYRLHIGPVGKVGIGHDGGRVAVQQHHLEPLLFQGLARLGAGIVELARLADYDGAGADNEDLFDVCSFRHCNSLLIVSSLTK